jgi:threonine dehydratase
MPTPLPTFSSVQQAAARLRPHARVTPVLRSDALDALAGAELHFKAEPLQVGGAFKYRGASNAVWALQAATAQRGVLTHSSGNHGTALALAARARGIPCHVVMPEGAVAAKRAAVLAAGATVHDCAPTLAAREAACAALAERTGAHLVHPYADADVIAGQGTVALELLHAVPALDALLVPVGGGGLASGSALTLAACSPHTALWLAEPTGAADAAQSLAAGRHVTALVPETICDGLRATLGAPDFEILHRHGARVITVDDADTLAAMRWLWQELRLLVEPSSATVLAAVLTARARFAGQRVGLVLSGGNVDLDALPALFAAARR